MPALHRCNIVAVRTARSDSSPRNSRIASIASIASSVVVADHVHPLWPGSAFPPSASRYTEFLA